MKRAILVVLLLAGTVGAQSDKNPVDYPTVEEAVKHGKPGDCLAFNGAGRYRSVSCNAGGAYQIIARPTAGGGYVMPKRTGEFHPQCRYKLDNGDSEVGDCPEVGEIHLKNGEHHEIDCTKDPCVGY